MSKANMLFPQNFTEMNYTVKYIQRHSTEVRKLKTYTQRAREIHTYENVLNTIVARSVQTTGWQASINRNEQMASHKTI